MRGAKFSRALSFFLAHHHTPLFARLVERSTRTQLLPGSELAQIRSSALSQIGPETSSINVEVARVLSTKQLKPSTSTVWPYRPVAGGRRFIVARSAKNPYYGMMYSKLHHVGFNVQYVATFTDILEALTQSQNSGESPHIHIDHWLSHDQAVLLVERMQPDSTLSVTAHDLEHSGGQEKAHTGMGVYLQRAAAIHLLTRSSLERLGISASTVEGRVFHVPHPAYLGEHAGAYALPRDRTLARAELGRQADEFAVGIVGRVSDRKNVELLLDAAAHLLKGPHGAARPPHFYISGALTTKFAEKIIRRAHSLRNVTLIAEDLDDATVGLHVSALDVGVVPYHGYLNSGWILLALSAGLPVIASRESTASEVVPREALIDFSEGDARSLARAIAESTHQNQDVARAAALARAREVHPEVMALRFAQEIAARVPVK